MPSLDFEREKSHFREYYDSQANVLANASRSLHSLLTDLLPQAGDIAISKIETRVKDRDECLRKFNLKYRQRLEESQEPYEIKDHITDLVGLRIVCLYEDQVGQIGDLLEEQFDVLGITDKISAIESSEGSFGYKGLHYDIRLKAPRLALPEYKGYAEQRFEVQVRTIIQDSWSVLDHKIKYKKSIPNGLKRRINTLAALFELADREFKQIRVATEDEIKKEELEPELEEPVEGHAAAPMPSAVPLGQMGEKPAPKSAKLNAFNFLKIAKHYFPGFEFEPQKVDGFVQEIVEAQPRITRSDLHRAFHKQLTLVKRYQPYLEQATSNTMNPYTVVRHCLYLDDKDAFQAILTAVAKSNFENWLQTEA